MYTIKAIAILDNDGERIVSKVTNKMALQAFLPPQCAVIKKKIEKITPVLIEYLPAAACHIFTQLLTLAEAFFWGGWGGSGEVPPWVAWFFIL